MGKRDGIGTELRMSKKILSVPFTAKMPCSARLFPASAPLSLTTQSPRDLRPYAPACSASKLTPHSPSNFNCKPCRDSFSPPRSNAYKPPELCLA